VVKRAYILQGRGIAVHIPPERLLPLRDRQKEPTVEEHEAIQIELISLVSKVATEQDYLDQVRARELESFSEIPIDPAIMAVQEQFRINRNPLTRYSHANNLRR
jgi:hypothetical protein